MNIKKKSQKARVSELFPRRMRAVQLASLQWRVRVNCFYSFH